MAEHRVLRIARGTVLGGAKLGAFTAVFCGVQHGLAVKRGCHDTYNVVVAGGVTGAAFGLTGTMHVFCLSLLHKSLFTTLPTYSDVSSSSGMRHSTS